MAICPCATKHSSIVSMDVSNPRGTPAYTYGIKQRGESKRGIRYVKNTMFIKVTR